MSEVVVWRQTSPVGGVYLMSVRLTAEQKQHGWTERGLVYADDMSEPSDEQIKAAAAAYNEAATRPGLSAAPPLECWRVALIAADKARAKEAVPGNFPLEDPSHGRRDLGLALRCPACRRSGGCFKASGCIRCGFGVGK